MPDQQLMLDSIGLRELAEYASGLRQAGVYFTVTTDPGQPGWYRIGHQQGPVGTDPDRVVVPANTPAVGRNRPAVKRVTITYADPASGAESHMHLDGSKYDAFFWSEGAVEKFLFPYYASKYQWAAADALTLMAKAWYGYVPDLLPDPAGQEVMDEVIPMGMVHYPRSDYGTVGEGTVREPESDVHVVTVADPLPIPLAEYRER